MAEGNGVVIEKQCAACKEVKTVDLFGTARNKRGEKVPHSYCKRCRSAVTIRYKAKRKRAELEETSPFWPVPAMGLVESLECIRLRRWGGAEPNARFGVPSIGVAA